MKLYLFILSAGITFLLLPISNVSAAYYQVADTATFDCGAGINDVNNQGVLVWTLTPNNISRAYTWSVSTGYSYLGPLSGYSVSSALSINDNGQVAGYSYTSSPDQSRACIWSDNQVIDVGALPSGTYSPDSAAYDINNLGQVVGRSRSGSNVGDAFLWSENVGMQDIGENACAYAINDNGVVVGNHGNNGFIWTSDLGMRDINIPDLKGTMAIDINNSGQVICISEPSATASSGPSYIWQDGYGATSLGVLAGSWNYTLAYAINNLGEVVGSSGCQPFIWNSTDGIKALPVPSGLSNGVATAINDNGLIIGYANDSSYKRHLLLWTSVPEPSSLLALSFGLLPLGFIAARRKR